MRRGRTHLRWQPWLAELERMTEDARDDGGYLRVLEGTAAVPDSLFAPCSGTLYCTRGIIDNYV